MPQIPPPKWQGLLAPYQFLSIAARDCLHHVSSQASQLKHWGLIHELVSPQKDQVILSHAM